MKAQDISHNSPKNKFRATITYNKLLVGIGGVSSVGAMTIDEVKHCTQWYSQNIKRAGGARVEIRENKADYPIFDWAIIEVYNL